MRGFVQGDVMYIRKTGGPRLVTLPDGTVMSRADLPPADTRRWVASRKAAVVRAVLARLQAEGLVDARPKRTATVALPTLAEARDVFEMRRALEAEVVRLVIKRWKPGFGAELEGLVREEDAARERGEEHVWGRLAGEFHIHLARLSGNALIARYMAELVTRCSLILAVFGRPHRHDGGADEHAEIIAAIRAGDADKAVAIMDRHMGTVESRAITGDDQDNSPELGDVLARYAGAIAARNSAVPLARKAAEK